MYEDFGLNLKISLREHYGRSHEQPPAIRPASALMKCLVRSLVSSDEMCWFLNGALEAHTKAGGESFDRYFLRVIGDHFPGEVDVCMEAAWQTMVVIHQLLDRRDSRFVPFIQYAIQAWEDAVAQSNRAPARLAVAVAQAQAARDWRKSRRSPGRLVGAADPLTVRFGQ
ncbi:hypothetical protein [Streptomyces sp. NPDC087437]|uniref:hypothetical protein n=1 Tax=Streptomyces sp. NPDC087437 TaxID=3365789 RepID=UPI0038309BF6